MQLGVKLSGGAAQAPEQLAGFTAFLGKAPDYLVAFGSDQAWSSPVGEFIWANGLLAYLKAGLPVVASIPLCPRSGGLAEVVSGKRDAEFRKAATALAGRITRLRVGWECNGKGMGWGRTLAPSDEQYRAAYEVVTDIFASISPDFRFIWGVLANPQDDAGFLGRLPGRNVHGIELDLYYYPEWSSTDPANAFAMYRDGKVGMESVRKVAVDRGVPFGLGEWGVRPNNGRFVELVAEWLRGHSETAYHAYWDDNAVFACRISDGKSGTTGDAYRMAFGPPPPDPRDVRITELEQQVETFKSELAATEQELDQLKSDHAALTLNAATLTATVEQAKARVAALKQAWRDLENF